MALASPTAPSMGGVPASNRSTSSERTARSLVTSHTVPPPNEAGSSVSNSGPRTQRPPMPVGAPSLWPEKAYMSQPRAETSVGRWTTPCAPSTTTTASLRSCAMPLRSAQSLAMPVTFESCVNATIFVLSSTSARKAPVSSAPAPSTGATRRSQPVLRARLRQTRMLEWCSIAVMTTFDRSSSRGASMAAALLRESVVPEVNTSSGSFPPMNSAAVRRASS